MFDYRRPFYRKILVVFNIFVLIAYLFVCLTPFVNTGENWLIALPGLAFPLLLLALLLFVILWTLLRSKWVWVSVVVIFLGIQQILAVFSFHLPQQFNLAKGKNTLRIFHWNVESWDDYFSKIDYPGESYRPEMMDLIKQQNPDVLCFEEYADLKSSDDSGSNVSEIKKLGFPYYLSAPTDTSASRVTNGVAIFSKYPVINSGIYSYGRHTQAEHLIFVDINIGKDTFRIFTTHLQSVRFERKDYRSLNNLKKARDPGFENSKDIISKLRRGYQFRHIQAQIVEQKIAESPYPAVITGDFNDVPNSNTYFTIRGKLQDAFLKKGYWIGRTFRFISPTLRIDFILADKKFKVDQFQVMHVPYSDHFPIETDLTY
ncbi:MAG TPA: endonuclease/exonuclease/phosphatase family protein [Hanamia sp.]